MKQMPMEMFVNAGQWKMSSNEARRKKLVFSLPVTSAKFSAKVCSEGNRFVCSPVQRQQKNNKKWSLVECRERAAIEMSYQSTLWPVDRRKTP